jgi:hypothetical protein
MALRTIIEDRDCMTEVEKFLDTHTSDVTGPAGDEYIHRA